MKTARQIALSVALCGSLSFASGLYENVNQSVHYLRNVARDASTDVDAVYSNPAGTAFLKDGWHVSANSQMFFQSRTIDTRFVNGTSREYEGETFVPSMPSLLAAWHRGNLALSGAFTIAGGGGSVEYDDGIPMFDAITLASTAAAGAPKTLHEVGGSASLEGTSYVYGLSFGVAYRFIPSLSAYVGARGNYQSNSYSAKATVPGMGKVSLDVDQTGWGVTPIVGLTFQYDRLTLGTKFEYNSSIEVENDSDVPAAFAAQLADFKDGAKVDADIPSYFAFGVRYDLLSGANLHASLGYRHFFDYWADYAGDREHYCGGTNEYVVGLEWDIDSRWTVSAGGQFTRYGLKDKSISEMNFNNDGNTIGFGGAFRPVEWMRVNVAYFHTFYEDYKGDKEAYGKNTYSRTNDAIGLGLDFDI